MDGQTLVIPLAGMLRNPLAHTSDLMMACTLLYLRRHAKCKVLRTNLPSGTRDKEILKTTHTLTRDDFCNKNLDYLCATDYTLYHSRTGNDPTLQKSFLRLSLPLLPCSHLRILAVSVVISTKMQWTFSTFWKPSMPCRRLHWLAEHVLASAKS